jgi:heptosyltransferase-2
VIIKTDLWCRPCMLRECPLDHACMTGIDVARVKTEVLRVMEGGRRSGVGGGADSVAHDHDAGVSDQRGSV